MEKINEKYRENIAADGPTAIFVAGKGPGNWINVFGVVIVVLLLIPNLVYAWKFRGQKNHCTNKGMNILEQLGWFWRCFRQESFF